jgi:predicted metal-dependent phosphoesterase TrpH
MNTVASLSTQPAAQNSTALKDVWRAIHPHSCPYHYNFHLHTACSDGQLTPENLIQQAVAIGLKGMAITDHHSVRGYQAAQDWLNENSHQSDRSLPSLWTGIEVTSELMGTEIHLLGYAFEPEHPTLQPYLQGHRPQGREAFAERVIDALHSAGGLVILAHPARYRRPADELIPAAVELGIDGVEAYYAYNNPKPWQPSIRETQQVTKLSELYGLFNTCGTDTHGASILQRI